MSDQVNKLDSEWPQLNTVWNFIRVPGWAECDQGRLPTHIGMN